MGRPGSKPAGLFARLAGDVRANTLAIMAAAMIPLIGMVGGAVDLSRMYIVKTRLQHACDAGALAGRKAMGGGTWAQSNGYPGKAATQFFKANISDNAYGATSIVSEYKESAGKVTGTATAVVPMTLMRVFNFNDEKLSVTCDAEMRLPNTDVMFVLDVTGSMAQRAVSSDRDTKIDSLKTAVKCFYEIVARLDTDATCSTGTPGGGTGDQVQIRFGFMPYSTNVNVGKLLPTSYFADSWTYQSRSINWNTTTSSAWVQTRQDVESNTVPVSLLTCVFGGLNGLNSTKETVSGKFRTVVTVVYTSPVIRSFSCSATQTTTTTIYENVTTTAQVFGSWHYGPTDIRLTGLKNGSKWNDRFTLRLGSSGADRTITWDGCIEERPTVSQTSYSPIPAGAYDMNIDLVPTPGDLKSVWGPALPEVIYLRKATSPSSYSQLTIAESDSPYDYFNAPPYACPAEARKLQTWPSASDFDNYVDSLAPTGNTYHDVGITWGARFMSPTGIFASDNAFTPRGGEIERHMIFMTDGDTQTSACDYASHGLPFFDKRTTANVGSAADCGRENSALNAQVNARFAALCTAVKNKNITLWVISFGSGSSTETEDRLEACASSGRYFTARNSATLQATFKSIADQISQLRLTK
jgi:Flp pilus assembly protein TadG